MNIYNATKEIKIQLTKIWGFICEKLWGYWDMFVNIKTYPPIFIRFVNKVKKKL